MEGINQQTILWIFGAVLALSQAAILFIWNNLKSDIKASKYDLKGDIKDVKDDIDGIRNDMKGKVNVNRLEEFHAVLDSKADSKEMDQRRNDIKELFTNLNSVEKALSSQMNELKVTILVKLESMKARNETSS